MSLLESSSIIIYMGQMSASSTANVSGSLDDGVPHAIPVVAVQPDQEDDPTVITVAPNIPPVIEASPPR